MLTLAEQLRGRLAESSVIIAPMFLMRHVGLILGTCLGLTGISLAQQNVSSAPAPTPAGENVFGKATLSFFAVDHRGAPVTMLQLVELSLRIDGEPQRILSVAPSNDIPQTIGIFFDTSGSRSTDKLVVKETEATMTFLRSIWHAGDGGFVIVFDKVPHSFTEPFSDLQQILPALEAIPNKGVRGDTAIYDALYSVRYGPETGHRERIFILVSDFEDNASHISKDKTIEAMREGDVRLFVLFRAYGDALHRETIVHDNSRAQEVAGKTGGDVFVVNNQETLEAAFQRLTGELQGSYLLTYEPSTLVEKRTNLDLKTTRQNVDLLYAHN